MSLVWIDWMGPGEPLEDCPEDQWYGLPFPAFDADHPVAVGL
jgi:hypothetical protein